MKDGGGFYARTRKWRWLLGLILFGALIAFVGPAELFALLISADPLSLVTLLVAACAWLLLGALNIWILLSGLTAFPLTRFVGIYVTSWSFSLVLPSQLGDASQILFLKAEGVPADRSTASYTIDKTISLTFLGVVGVCGLMLYTPGAISLKLTAILIGLGGGLLALTVLNKARTRWSWFERINLFLASVKMQILRFRKQPRRLALNVGLTVVKWLLAGAQYWLAFHALGGSVPFEAAATIPIVSSLVAYIPVTVGGLGTMEITAVALFDGIGVSAALVVSAFILVRAVLIATAGLILVSRPIAGFARARLR